MKFELDFRPASETPKEPGDYLLYNKCDGYHVVEAWFDENEFSGFWFFASPAPISEKFYSAWALLPNSIKDLYEAFAKEPT